jgi:hypothetical protein
VGRSAARPYVAPVYSLAWVAALLLNVGVAIYLAILLKLDS